RVGAACLIQHVRPRDDTVYTAGRLWYTWCVRHGPRVTPSIRPGGLGSWAIHLPTRGVCSMMTPQVRRGAAGLALAAGAAAALAQGPAPIVPPGYQPPGAYPATVTGAVLDIR